MLEFNNKIKEINSPLSPLSVETLQVNITKLCNQACHHCHVDSSPKRREMMSPVNIDRILRLLQETETIVNLDITGGAPELHPQFKYLVQAARRLKKKVIIRHNLTVTFDPHPMTGEPMLDLPSFFHDEGVEIVSSLPYYREYLTDQQRGSGVFRKSIMGLRALNQEGFGVKKEMILNLVYNPTGHYLPGSQTNLEKEYKRELLSKFNIQFNQLFVLTNMPIHRFKKDLERSNHYEEYMEKLFSAFNPEAAQGIMCRKLLSVSWDGIIYDCDFNQMLGMPVSRYLEPVTLETLNLEEVLQRKIIFANHCYGCTAGAGSSCGGKTT
jgi:radical SAM/Cys-rich protein